MYSVQGVRSSISLILFKVWVYIRYKALGQTSFIYPLLFGLHVCIQYKALDQASVWYYLRFGSIFGIRHLNKEVFEETKGVIRIRKSTDKQRNGQRETTKGQTTIYKNYTESKRSNNTDPTKNRGELRCSGRINSSWSTSGTRRVALVTNPVISHEWGNDREVLTTSGTYPWTFWYYLRLGVYSVQDIRTNNTLISFMVCVYDTRYLKVIQNLFIE